MRIRERLFMSQRLFTLSLITALRGTRDNLRMVVWQPFAISLGLDMRSIGTLESVMDLVKNLMEPAFGAISDAIGRKKLTVLREVLIVVASITFVLAWSWHLLFVGIVLLGISAALVSVWSTMVAESAEETNLASVYGILGTFYTGAGLLGAFSAGYIADALGLRVVYGLSAILAGATLFLVWRRLPETRRGDPKPINWREAVTAFSGAFNPPKSLRGFYAAMTLDLIAFNTGVRLINGMLAKGYGYTPGMIGLCLTAMTLTWALLQIPFGRLSDRFGYTRFLALSQFTACIMLGICIYSKAFEYIFVAHLIFGLANAFWMPAEQAWIAANVDPAERGKALSNFSAFRGFLAIPAPMIGGWLFDAYGFDIPIAFNLILAFLDGVLILLVVKDKPRIALLPT